MSALLLELAAATLGDVVDDVVFVGGATIHVWQSEPGAPPTRATDDVDVVCEAATRGRYEALASRLRKQGFGESPQEPVICRWRHRESGLVLDVMPDDARVFGFTNRWYRLALDTAVARRLPSGARIRAAAPPVLLATKLAAWSDRGDGDVIRSLDVHDVVALVDGRPELADELRVASPDVAAYVRRELALLCGDPYLDYVIESALQGYGRVAFERARLVRERIDAIASAPGRRGDEGDG